MPFLPPNQQHQSTEVLCMPSPQSHLNLLQGTKCKKQKKLHILITKTGMLRRNKVKWTYNLLLHPSAINTSETVPVCWTQYHHSQWQVTAGTVTAHQSSPVNHTLDCKTTSLIHFQILPSYLVYSHQSVLTAVLHVNFSHPSSLQGENSAG